MQGLRFGNDKEACLQAIDLGFEQSSKPSNTVYKGAIDTFEMVSNMRGQPKFPALLLSCICQCMNNS